MEFYQEVERSIITTYRGKIWSKFIKALKEYRLLNPQDHICVLLRGSGSFVLAKLFQELERHSDFPFEVDFVGINRESVKKNVELLKIPVCEFIEEGNIQSWLKKQSIHIMVEDKNYDDVIETTMMNVLFNGEFKTILPQKEIEDIIYIQPLYLVRERDITAWKNYNHLLFEENPKEEIQLQTKKWIHDLLSYNSAVEKNIFISTSNVYIQKVLGYKKDGEKVLFLDNYEKE